MISKRAKRSATPQETLKQFALNTSKGIDCTKEPTSSDTVASMVNLVVNPDGSVSPRKYIKQLNTYPDAYFVKYLYDNETAVVVSDGTYPGLVLQHCGTHVPFTLRFTDYRGAIKNISNVTHIPKEFLNLEGDAHRPLEVMNAGTSSILGNVRIKIDAWLRSLDALARDLHLNPALYDGSVFETYVARYIKVWRDPVSEGWIVEIISPQLNRLTDAESDIPINPNTTLDNPFAIRDTYNTSYASVKNILPYAYSKRTPDGIVPVETPGSVNVSESVSTSYTDATSGWYVGKVKPTILDKPTPDGYLFDELNSTYSVCLWDSELYGAKVFADITFKTRKPYMAGSPYGMAVRTESFDIIDYVKYTQLYVTVKIRVEAPVSNADFGMFSLDINRLKLTIYSYTMLDIDNDSTFETYYSAVTTLDIPYVSSEDKYDQTHFTHYSIVSEGSGGGMHKPQVTLWREYPTPDHDPEHVQHVYDISFEPKASEALDLGRVNDISVDLAGTLTYTKSVNKITGTVAELTESVRSESYRLLTAVSPRLSYILKAFCTFPTPVHDDNDLVYASWMKSYDGATWESAVEAAPNTVIVQDNFESELEPKNGSKNDSDTDSDSASTAKYVARNFIKLNAESELDVIQDVGQDGELTVARADVYAPVLPESRPAQYVFRMCLLRELSADDPMYDKTLSGDQYRVLKEYGRAVYNAVLSPSPEFATYDYANSALGKKLLYKKSIYSYFNEKFYNNIFVSGIDSFETPLYNIIDVDTSVQKRITCVIPWRDYFISTTGTSMSLHTKTTDGYLTKTVSTSIGIPDELSDCCKPALNGIVFHTFDKVFYAYPSVYASEDTSLNIVEISQPISQVLDLCDTLDGYTRFAFVTSTEYVLMVPTKFNDSEQTLCFRYDLTDKVWSVMAYPVLFNTYSQTSLDDIRLYCSDTLSLEADGRSCVREFQFDCDSPVDVPTLTAGKCPAYGDIIGGKVVPIEFEWDTGQKTDSIAQTKQFVESKLMLATDDALEAFPMELTVAIDGDPHVIHKDINTDSPFWNSDDLETKGTLGTSFRLGNEELGYSDKGILRQLVVRYSGKGRSVRHILKGRTRSKFKLYETYVRYKTLNVKR